MKLNFENTDKPIFVQLYEMIEDNILADVFVEGSQIPSTTEISATFKVNPATAGKSVGHLADEGIVFKKRGIGMFVSEGAKEKIRQAREDQFTEKFIDPLLQEARNLGISDASLLKVIEDKLKSK